MHKRLACLSLATLALLLIVDGAAFAQLAHHPFAIGVGEGAVGHQNALGAWLLGRESGYFLRLNAAVRAVRESAGATAGLIGLSFAYGVFHAAGPGHGKAVIAAYMISNEVALRRGLLIAFLAALLQAFVATGVIGIAALVFNATAPTMTAAAEAISLASYLGIVALGLLLVWRKGRAVLALRATRPWPSTPSLPMSSLPMSSLPMSSPLAMASTGASFRVAGEWQAAPARRFVADDGAAHVHAPGCDCGRSHMPDPTLLAADRFDWKAAGIAIVTAGARPCSGAILVLVFALAQGVLAAGIAATFAMALGTALTTGALATSAVFAKGLAVRFSGGSSRAALVGRLVELAAAAGVLLLGIALLSAVLVGARTGA